MSDLPSTFVLRLSRLMPGSFIKGWPLVLHNLPLQTCKVSHTISSTSYLYRPLTAQGTFAQDALKILADLLEKYDHVLMTGGSGLYIQAVCQGLDAIPPVASAIRVFLNTRLSTAGLPALVAELADRDPAYHQVVDQENPQRVIRALEVCLATGQAYSTFRKHQPAKRSFTTIKVGLIRDRQALFQRIDQRVEQMIEQGLMQEVAALYPYRHCNALRTVGYRELFGHLDGHYDQEEAVRLIKKKHKKIRQKAANLV